MALDLVRSGQYKVSGGTVKFFPSPDGVIRVVALNEMGEWLAEWACREKHFTMGHLQRIEAFVATVAVTDGSS
jgi:hypothetical protein